MGVCYSSHSFIREDYSIGLIEQQPDDLKTHGVVVMDDRNGDLLVETTDNEPKRWSHVRCLHSMRNKVCLYRMGELQMVVCQRMHSTMRLSREWETHQCLLENPHDNIVTLYQCLSDNDAQCYRLFFPYIRGKDLHDIHLERGGFIVENDLCFYMRQVVDALLHLKKVCNVAHMDVSPENIMVREEDGACILIDMEFCMSPEIIRQPCGKIGYMAPELRKKKLPDFCPFACDVWSLGSTMFSLLHGKYLTKPDFENDLTFLLLEDNLRLDDVLEMTGRTKRKQLPRYSSLSSEVKDLLNNMIVCNPRRRMTLEQVSNHPWLSPH